MSSLEALPLTLGALIFMVSALVGVIKGYRWLLGEIKATVTDALRLHEAKESAWQTEVTHRLDEIERKVDRITGEK